MAGFYMKCNAELKWVNVFIVHVIHGFVIAYVCNIYTKIIFYYWRFSTREISLEIILEKM